jgi:putative oxidoreductase
MRAHALYCSTTQTFESWAPSVLSLGLRLWLALIFFQSGLTKIASWNTTLALFEYEYEVALLPPALAAWLGTGVELAVPVLLALGLFTRPSAAVLFAFNAVAAISYPDISEAGIKDHVYWGMLLTVPLALGGGRVALDQVWRRLPQDRAEHVA